MAIVLSLVLLSLGICFLVLIHICIVGRVIRQEVSTNNLVTDRGSLASTSMSQEDIEKLPCFDFIKKEVKGSNSPCPNCAVCLENFVVGEKCRLLPSCNHSFHAECVDLWLQRAPVCPICRANADVAGSDSMTGVEGGYFEETQVVSRVENEGVVPEEIGNLNDHVEGSLN